MKQSCHMMPIHSHMVNFSAEGNDGCVRAQRAHIVPGPPGHLGGHRFFFFYFSRVLLAHMSSFRDFREKNRNFRKLGANGLTHSLKYKVIRMFRNISKNIRILRFYFLISNPWGYCDSSPELWRPTSSKTELDMESASDGAQWWQTGHFRSKDCK